MSKNIRIIPRLDIKGPNVVKPVMTEALRIVGNPRELAYRYYKEGADEIAYMDIVASLYGRNLDLDQLKAVTEGIFIPITIGGGIRSIGDINNALRAGADKVAINTYAVHHPKFLKEAVETFGAQCIVLAVDAKKQPDGSYEPYTDGGREKTGLEVVPWVKRAVEMGVGEVMIASVDREGTRAGYDLSLVKSITTFAPVPVIVHGGAGSLESIFEVIDKGKADAISASSIFHYNELTIRKVKKYLKKKGSNVRLT
mgnify:CR=1 FL=1